MSTLLEAPEMVDAVECGKCRSSIDITGRKLLDEVVCVGCGETSFVTPRLIREAEDRHVAGRGLSSRSKPLPFPAAAAVHEQLRWALALASRAAVDRGARRGCGELTCPLCYPRGSTAPTDPVDDGAPDDGSADRRRSSVARDADAALAGWTRLERDANGLAGLVSAADVEIGAIELLCAAVLRLEQRFGYEITKRPSVRSFVSSHGPFIRLCLEQLSREFGEQPGNDARSAGAPPQPIMPSEPKHDMPPFLHEYLQEQEQWAAANERDARSEAVRFWALKAPALLASASSGILAMYNLRGVSAGLGFVATLCILIA